jgi:hypothetical protein
LQNSQPLNDEQRFGHVRLAEETRQLITQGLMGEEITRLNRYLLEDAYPAEIVQHQREWTAQAHAFLPSGVELSKYIAYEADFPPDNPYDLGDLAKVSSYYVGRGPRDTLRNLLRTVINHDYQVGRLHRFLANIPVPLVIVTTNYDTLIEQAFHGAKAYDLVIYPNDGKVTSEWANAVLWRPHGEAQPTFRETNQLEKDIDLDKTTVIYKMHGTIIRGPSDEWDNFVITEDDYAEFLSRMITQGAIPSLFRSHFLGRSFLFLGYGLRDWNLRVLLTSLKQRDDHVRSWAIQRRPSPYERILWNRRNVDIFDLTLDEFVRKMEAARQDLGY